MIYFSYYILKLKFKKMNLAPKPLIDQRAERSELQPQKHIDEPGALEEVKRHRESGAFVSGVRL